MSEDRGQRFGATEEGVTMFWEILAWAAVVLLTVFRVALVVGVVALVYHDRASAARPQAAGEARRRACTQVARASTKAPVPGSGTGAFACLQSDLERQWA